jgi:DNA-binding beta-propeller fold protein YncE
VLSDKNAAAPEFPSGLDWLNTGGKPLTLSGLKGKVVLLDFWTYGCINCIHVIPELKRLEKDFPHELVVIGVHSAKFASEGDTNSIRRIILRYGLEHPVVNDRDLLVWRSWNVKSWPTLILIDPAGKVVARHSGEDIYYLLKPVIASVVGDFDSRGLLDRTPLPLRLEKDTARESQLSFPGKVLADGDRGLLFISDTSHHRIVVARLPGGEVADIIGRGGPGFEDGTFASATFRQPQGLAFSPEGGTLYVADRGNHAIRLISLSGNDVKTLAGVGFKSDAYPPRAGRAPKVALSSPWDLALDGQRLFVAMAGSHQIWMMDLGSGYITPYAGSGREGTADGPREEAELAQPSGLALDGAGRLYFADSEASSLRWVDIDAAGSGVSTLAGSGLSLFDFGDIDGVGRGARFQHPLGVVFSQGIIYVADTYNNKIKSVDPLTGEVRTLAGNGPGWRDGDVPLFHEPGGLSVSGDQLYVADTNNHAVRVIDLRTGETTTMRLRIGED